MKNKSATTVPSKQHIWLLRAHINNDCKVEYSRIEAHTLHFVGSEPASSERSRQGEANEFKSSGEDKTLEYAKRHDKEVFQHDNTEPHITKLIYLPNILGYFMANAMILLFSA